MIKKNKQRNSSIELLKLIALTLIIISHSVPYGGVDYEGFINLDLASNDLNKIVLIFFRYFGSFGNCIFVICSSWFLVDSNKFNKDKILSIIYDSIFLTLVTFLVFKFIGGYNFENKELIKMLMPITFGLNWFITCYLLFYVLHPFINYIIDKLNQKQLLSCVIILVVLYSFIATIKDNLFYTNRLIGFIMIYFIVAYLKKYLRNFSNNKKMNVMLIITSIILFIILILFTNFLGLHISFFSDKMLYWNKFINPLILIISICLFNLFSTNNFYSKLINYISSLSLLIYIIHANRFVDNYFKATYFEYILNNYNYNYIILWVLFLAIIFMVFSILIATIYKKIIQKYVYRYGNKIYSIISQVFDRLMSSIIKIN